MGDTARYSTLHQFAESEKRSRLVRKSVSYSLLALFARCFSLSLLYYVLVVVSMKLRFSTSGLSLLWPSNALLIATLVLTPKRRWWVYLLSVVPAHIAALSPYHLGLSWLAYQIAFNSIQAIACAVILQRFRPAILYFETLKEVLIFLGVSVVVPGLANLVAIYPVVNFSSRAGLLAHNSSDGFLAVWTSCWANNSASLIVFVPVILVCVTRGRDFIRSLSWRRVGEGALLTVLLTTLTFLAYGNVHKVGDALPTVYLIPIPFLIWAAVRFGPAGACLSITLFVCVSSWCAYLGQGPFLRSVSIDRVTVLQTAWIIISAPLLCLAAVVRERRVAVEELKKAHSELQEFVPRLIAAQEQEKQRIARELHDDVVQRLALLSLELEGVQEDIPDAASELRTRIGALGNQTAQIVDDVQSLSHELHSSKLEYLGIVGATKNFCKEFSERQKVEIDFQSRHVPTALPTELSLSLFRVLQEALRNAAKHSGVKRFEVRLWGSTGEIQLTISDRGAGFDTETAMKSVGLGLTSMQERLRLLHGELSIKSQPRGGTTIHARIPFDSSSDSARAAG
jgi:signal transduction histidine kinase